MRNQVPFLKSLNYWDCPLLYFTRQSSCQLGLQMPAMILLLEIETSGLANMIPAPFHLKNGRTDLLAPCDLLRAK